MNLVSRSAWTVVYPETQREAVKLWCLPPVSETLRSTALEDTGDRRSKAPEGWVHQRCHSVRENSLKSQSQPSTLGKQFVGTNKIRWTLKTLGESSRKLPIAKLETV